MVRINYLISEGRDPKTISLEDAVTILVEKDSNLKWKWNIGRKEEVRKIVQSDLERFENTGRPNENECTISIPTIQVTKRNHYCPPTQASKYMEALEKREFEDA